MMNNLLEWSLFKRGLVNIKTENIPLFRIIDDTTEQMHSSAENKNITKEGSRGAKKKVAVWSLDGSFQYLKQVREILVDPSLLIQENLVERFRPIGKIKLIIVSGVFIGDPKSRADLLIVGDKIKKNVLQQVIKGLEAEIGKELDYVVFDSLEFKYRMDMYDKLVCDIIELPHEKLVDSGQLSTYISKK